jgi:hypothetical protein
MTVFALIQALEKVIKVIGPEAEVYVSDGKSEVAAYSLSLEHPKFGDENYVWTATLRGGE